jgi:hypothetical protein
VSKLRYRNAGGVPCHFQRGIWRQPSIQAQRSPGARKANVHSQTVNKYRCEPNAAPCTFVTKGGNLPFAAGAKAFEHLPRPVIHGDLPLRHSFNQNDIQPKQEPRAEASCRSSNQCIVRSSRAVVGDGMRRSELLSAWRRDYSDDPGAHVLENHATSSNPRHGHVFLGKLFHMLK